jgi:hypothetical protein
VEQQQKKMTHSTNDEADESIISGFGSDHGEADIEKASKSENEKRHSEIARKETRLVNCSKFLVLLVISLMAAAIGYVVFSYVSNQEESSCQKQVRKPIV